jgi:aminobenzoyl-glutamate utilization protein B
MRKMLALAVMMGAAGSAVAQTPNEMEIKQAGFALVDANAAKMAKVNDAIYSYSEIGFQEVKTIALVTAELKKAGFTVTTGVADMPTAYIATYGKGGPVIGLMSDFDGVPYVLVNGVLVVDKGEHTGARPGRVLYGKGAKPELVHTY